MRLVLCNSDPAIAERIAHEVIKMSLAASVTALEGVKRFYYREDGIGSQDDTLLLIQTLEDRLPDLIRRLVELQNQKMPAIISLSIFEGNEDYMKWVEESLRKE